MVQLSEFTLRLNKYKFYNDVKELKDRVESSKDGVIRRLQK